MTKNRIREPIAQEVAEATEVVAGTWLRPSCQRLLPLVQHLRPAVRIYATVLFTDLVMGNLPVFAPEWLDEVAYLLLHRSNYDPDPTARACFTAHLEMLLDAAAGYGHALLKNERSPNG